MRIESTTTESTTSTSAFKCELERIIRENPALAHQRIRLNINHTHYDDYPILLASQMNDTEAVLFLLNHGVDASIQDDAGRTPQNYARHYDNPVLIKAIASHESKRTAQIEEQTNQIVANVLSGNGTLSTALLSNEACRNAVIHQLSLALEKNIHQYQMICDAIKTPGESEAYDLSLLVPASHNILRNTAGVKDGIGLFSSLLTDVLWLRGQTTNPALQEHYKSILMQIIEHADPNSCQLKVNDHVFNLMQTMLLCYNNDEQDFAFIQTLCDRNETLFNFNEWQEDYTTNLFFYQSSANNPNTPLEFLHQSAITHKRHQTTVNDQSSSQSRFNGYAAADNALQLMVQRGFFDHQSALMALLAQRSELIHLAEALVELSASIPSINTRMTLSVSNSTPILFSNKASADAYSLQQNAELSSACRNGSLKKSHRIRPVFVFYANGNNTAEGAKELTLQLLLETFIARGETIEYDDTNRVAMTLLTERGDAFHKNQRYQSAAASYYAAQLFYSLIKSSNINDHLNLLDLFERHANSIERTSHPQCGAIANSDRTLAAYICQYLHHYGTTRKEQVALQTTQAFSRIPNTPTQPASKISPASPAQSGLFAKASNDINHNNTDKGTQFRQAASNGDLNQMKQLINETPLLLNQQGAKTGKTALHQAIINKQYAVVQYLIVERQARTDIKDNKGKTALAHIDPNDEQLNSILNQGHTKLSQSR